MLNQPPKFDFHYVVYLKSDPAKEPIAVGDSALRTLADASFKTGRPKADFELRSCGSLPDCLARCRKKRTSSSVPFTALHRIAERRDQGGFGDALTGRGVR
jgi:hypothetical protein